VKSTAPRAHDAALGLSVKTMGMITINATKHNWAESEQAKISRRPRADLSSTKDCSNRAADPQ